MKSFIIAAVILSSIITLVTISSLYIVNKTERLIAMCERLTETADVSGVDELLTKWHEYRKIFSFTVNKLDLERADSAFRAVDVYRHNISEYKFRLYELKSALRSIGDSGRLSYNVIF